MELPDFLFQSLEKVAPSLDDQKLLLAAFNLALPAVDRLDGLQAVHAGGKTTFDQRAGQSVSLVGRSAVIPSDRFVLPAQGAAAGAFELPASADVAVDIADASGAIVRHLDLGALPAGTQNFSWDGNGEDGSRLAPGVYLISAHGRIGGRTESLATSVAARIDSVSVDPSSGVTLNLEHFGPTPISAVSQYM